MAKTKAKPRRYVQDATTRRLIVKHNQTWVAVLDLRKLVAHLSLTAASHEQAARDFGNLINRLDARIAELELHGAGVELQRQRRAIDDILKTFEKRLDDLAQDIRVLQARNPTT